MVIGGDRSETIVILSLRIVRVTLGEEEADCDVRSVDGKDNGGGG